MFKRMREVTWNCIRLLNIVAAVFHFFIPPPPLSLLLSKFMLMYLMLDVQQ